MALKFLNREIRGHPVEIAVLYQFCYKVCNKSVTKLVVPEKDNFGIFK